MILESSLLFWATLYIKYTCLKVYTMAYTEVKRNKPLTYTYYFLHGKVGYTVVPHVGYSTIHKSPTGNSLYKKDKQILHHITVF